MSRTHAWFTLPITIAVIVLLLTLVVSYSQVTAVHPDGGGAYAVAKQASGAAPACWPRRAWPSTTC